MAKIEKEKEQVNELKKNVLEKNNPEQIIQEPQKDKTANSTMNIS